MGVIYGSIGDKPYEMKDIESFKDELRDICDVESEEIAANLHYSNDKEK